MEPIVMAMRALTGLAKRKLSDQHAHAYGAETLSQNKSIRQPWHELTIESQAALMASAREEVGIPHAEYRAALEEAIQNAHTAKALVDASAIGDELSAPTVDQSLDEFGSLPKPLFPCKHCAEEWTWPADGLHWSKSERGWICPICREERDLDKGRCLADVLASSAARSAKL